MTSPSPVEVAEVAKSLSKAQHAVLLAGSKRPKAWRTILRHAKRRGRIGRRLEFFERDTSHSLNSFRLRPFGLAVRNHLLTEPSA